MNRKSLTTMFLMMMSCLVCIAFADTGVPPSVIIGMDPGLENAHQILDQPDVQTWLMEDERNENRGMPLRIGAYRLLDPEIEKNAQWIEDTEYGLIWRLAITSPGASELKLHLSDVKLSPNDELYIYSPGDEYSIIYESQDVFSDNSLWSWGSKGHTIVLEWHLDEGLHNEQLELPFNVRGISHIYKDLDDVVATREGNCHNDATCDMDYRPQRDASAHIEFNDNGTYICSGTMLNNTSADFTPYFLTANHCISSNTVASTVKAWFFFNTETCNGAVPNRGFRTVSGATLLATGNASGGSGSDFSLLQLSNADYTGVYFAGWDRADLSNGTAITSIHHPDGAYKRISYGTVRSTWYSGQWGVNWDRTSNPGVTEGGSSGSALFKDSNHRVVGQLWAGSSACNYQSGRDFYGRFGNSFSQGNFAQWLGNSTAVDGVYWNSGGSTPTPAPPTFTPTPRPTGTHYPTNTPNPSWTPTPQPDLAVEIVMPSTMVKPGDLFGTSVVLTNTTGSTFNNVVLFVILDVAGTLFFAPEFNDFSFYSMYLPPGNQTKVIVPTFEWPKGVGSATGILWYAGFTNSEMTALIGSYDVLSFGWTE